MHLVEEKIGVTAVDEDDELVLDFCRLGAGPLLVPVVVSDPVVDIFGEGVWSWFWSSGLISQPQQTKTFCCAASSPLSIE
jgi:hypothetical protein